MVCIVKLVENIKQKSGRTDWPSEGGRVPETGRCRVKAR